MPEAIPSHHESARDTFRFAPALLQPIITWISGRPLSGTIPSLSLSPAAAVAIDFAKYALGIVLSTTLLREGGYWLLFLPGTWILTVNGARSLTSDAHYAGHAVVTGRKRVDRVLGDLLSLSVLSPNMDDYAQGHNRDHHGKAGIGTLEDPDIALMQLLGFETGRARVFYPLRLLASLVSPRFHMAFLLLRLKTTLMTAPIWRMALAWALIAICATVVMRNDGLAIFLTAWVIPLVPLYAISAALQFPSEHMWLCVQAPDEDRRAYLLRVSHGRFFILPAPRREGLVSFGSWLLWSVRMTPLLFQRFFVCVSILPAHDYHHRYANRRDWPMEPHLRQADLDGGARYTDYTGICLPTAKLFDAWSRMPRSVAPVAPTTLALAERLLRRSFDRPRLKVGQGSLR